MPRILLLFLLLSFGVATAEVQTFPEQEFQVEFASPGWVVASQDPDLVTFQLGEPVQVLFATALAPRPENWETFTPEERQDKAKAALEKSSQLRVASIKDREFLGYPGTLMYLIGEDETGHHTDGFSLVFTTEKRTYLLTALAPAENEELLKTEFAAIMKSFAPLVNAKD